MVSVGETIIAITTHIGVRANIHLGGGQNSGVVAYIFRDPYSVGGGKSQKCFR